MAGRVNAKRLRQAVEGAGVPQVKVAERLGISKQLLTHWLQGRRVPSDEQLQALAAAVGVDASFLTGAMGEPSAATAAPDDLRGAEWTFREAPADGGRDYGNANVLAFTPDIETLVRELGQNALDQVLRSSMHLRFSLIELRRGSPAYAAFMEAMKWDALKPHIERAIEQSSRLSSKLRRGLAGLERLLLLRVDDFATTGAYGGETTSDDREERSPFAALVRDNLNSSKESNIAGGTHGAGKGTAWQCSDIGTVLISSRIAGPLLLDGQPEEALRFIAKAELTWHHSPSGSGAKAGPGWLAGRQNARSLWLAPDSLEPVFLDRSALPEAIDDAAASGTSLLIVGFRDPQEDGEANPAAIMTRIQRAAAENFFPAMLEGRMAVTVEHHVDGELKDRKAVTPGEYVPEMVAAYVAHRDGELVAPGEAAAGDTTHAHVAHTVPATRHDAAPTLQRFEDLDARSDLVVRFAKPEEVAPVGIDRRPVLNYVALVRGRLMVVEYLRRSNLVVGARPFHAIVLAGEAAGDGAAQAAAEQFFRLAEPPSHNKWMWREDVRDNYRPGAKRCLTDFYQGVTDTLRGLIKPDEAEEDDGPDELRKLLFLAGPTRTTALAVLRSVTERRLEGGAWHIAAEVVVNDRKRDLILTPRLAVLPESGVAIDLDWEMLEVARATHGEAIATPEHEIEVPAGTTRLLFKALSKPAADGLDLSRCKVVVRVAAREAPATEQAATKEA